MAVGLSHQRSHIRDRFFWMGLNVSIRSLSAHHFLGLRAVGEGGHKMAQSSCLMQRWEDTAAVRQRHQVVFNSGEAL